MNSDSKLYLSAAVGVVLVVVAVVVVFGITAPPAFPDLYDDDGPTIEGAVAYVTYGRDDCVHVLDVATGDSQEIFCDNWVALEGWDRDGNLRIHSGNGHDSVAVVDPDSGDLLEWDDFPHDAVPPRHTPLLRARSHDGHTTLVYRGDDGERTLIDVAASRNYEFWEYGITSDGKYAWVCDSEDRLLVVALDGGSGPWVVVDGVSQPVWN